MVAFGRGVCAQGHAGLALTQPHPGQTGQGASGRLRASPGVEREGEREGERRGGGGSSGEAWDALHFPIGF